jgi:hypothetical protein
MNPLSAETPPFAPVVVLAFLASAAFLCVSLLTLVIGLWRKSRMIQQGSVLAVCLLVAVYAGILLCLSFLSHEIVLPMEGRKYFCEIDCHIAYSVQSAVEAANVGGELQQLTSKGDFIVVGVRSWFDPQTISPGRGDGPLTPNGRHIALVGDDGRLIAPSGQQEGVLAALRLHSVPLRTELHPGESYVSYFVFELPASVGDPKVLLTSTDEETPILWGHENSWFHKKIYLRLPQGLSSAALQ